VFIDGVCRKRDGVLLGVDVRAVLDTARKAREGLVARIACA
jgi:hypothetical protein